MFMIPGSDNVVRVNGEAVLTDDPDVTDNFERGGRRPRSVVVIEVREVYFQCAKALMRSDLWSGTPRPQELPTAGDLVREVNSSFDAEGFDSGYAQYAKPRMW